MKIQDFYGVFVEKCYTKLTRGPSYWFAIAFVTNYHNLSCLKHHKFLPNGSGGLKSLSQAVDRAVLLLKALAGDTFPFHFDLLEGFCLL